MGSPPDSANNGTAPSWKYKKIQNQNQKINSSLLEEKRPFFCSSVPAILS